MEIQQILQIGSAEPEHDGTKNTQRFHNYENHNQEGNGHEAFMGGIVKFGTCSYIINYNFIFEFTYVPDLLEILGFFFGITALTVCVGLLNSRSIVRQSPLTVLRNET